MNGICKNCGKIQLDSGVGFCNPKKERNGFVPARLCIAEKRIVLQIDDPNYSMFGVMGSISDEIIRKRGGEIRRFDTDSMEIVGITYPLDRRYGFAFNKVNPDSGVRILFSNGADIILRLPGKKIVQQVTQLLVNWKSIL